MDGEESSMSLSNLEKYPESMVRIRFPDCDPFGHLNNGRYLDYFITAREEHVQDHYGLNLFGERFKNQNWVVRQSMVSHLQPARMNDQVWIRTRLIDYSRNSLLVEGVMLDASQESVLAVSWVDLRYIDLVNGRPMKHEDDLMAIFESVHVSADFRFGQEKGRIREIRRAKAA
ncbi:MAG: thioesterase [Spirochaetaceae bacterium]|nr:thioesterase [Spirochaetaceae bacterium]|tara:strand:+ start:25 stop:543 length:519 start_codon:yes stop_codon:yes gene_type:complete